MEVVDRAFSNRLRLGEAARRHGRHSVVSGQVPFLVKLRPARCCGHRPQRSTWDHRRGTRQARRVLTRQSVARLGVAILAWSRPQPGVTCGNPLRRSSCSDLIERGKRGWSSRRHASNHAPPLTRCLVRHLTEGPPPRFLLSVDPSACLFFVLTPDAAGFGYRCLLDWGPDRWKRLEAEPWAVAACCSCAWRCSFKQPNGRSSQVSRCSWFPQSPWRHGTFLLEYPFVMLIGHLAFLNNMVLNCSMCYKSILPYITVQLYKILCLLKLFIWHRGIGMWIASFSNRITVLPNS